MSPKTPPELESLASRPQEFDQEWIDFKVELGEDKKCIFQGYVTDGAFAIDTFMCMPFEQEQPLLEESLSFIKKKLQNKLKVVRNESAIEEDVENYAEDTVAWQDLQAKGLIDEIW